MRKAILVLLLILFFLVLPIPAFANPYSYTWSDGGNCTWFAWEMAREHWHVGLPDVGNALNWTALAGQTFDVEWQTYQIQTTDTPAPDEIMVFQPSALEFYNMGQPFDTSYGHVAWVTGVTTWPTGPETVDVSESTIWPTQPGLSLDGCWYQAAGWFWPRKGNVVHLPRPVVWHRNGVPGVTFLKLVKE